MLSENGSCIEYNGHKYGPITMGDLIKLQDAMPLDHIDKAFAGVSDHLRFSMTPLGLPIFISMMAEKHDSPTDDLTDWQKLEIVGNLHSLFMGVTSEKAKPGEPTPVPLAVSGTGT